MDVKVNRYDSVAIESVYRRFKSSCVRYKAPIQFEEEIADCLLRGQWTNG
ncbi:hypothetical protein MLD52_08775 [Puniceicoccaceae bacterium K14]|nr:hypothetical protein [Puniceicoccaceae bacterium K14]